MSRYQDVDLDNDYESDNDDARDRGQQDVEGEEDSSATFVEDGITIEPFNMRKERNEGYIDKSGHFVEYRRNRDAWLDEIDEHEKKLKDRAKKQAKTGGKSSSSSSSSAAAAGGLGDDDDDEEDDDEDEDGSTGGKRASRRKSNTQGGGDTDDDEEVALTERVGHKRKGSSRPSAADAATERADAREKAQRDQLDALRLRQEMVALLRPGESVLAAIKRLGAAAKKAASTAPQQQQQQQQQPPVAGKYGKNRLQLQKAEREQRAAAAAAAGGIELGHAGDDVMATGGSDGSDEEAERQRAAAKIEYAVPRRARVAAAVSSPEQQAVSRLTEFADALLGSGLMGTETYESLSLTLRRAGRLPVDASSTSTSPSSSAAAAVPSSSSSTASSASTSSGVDYFSGSASAPKAASAAPTSSSNRSSGSKQWQYKTSEDKAAAVYGPFPTETMLTWYQQGYLGQSIWIRTFDAYTDDDDEFSLLTDNSQLR